jgi:hypothetical protein
MKMTKIERGQKTLEKWVRPTLRRFPMTAEIVDRIGATAAAPATTEPHR